MNLLDVNDENENTETGQHIKSMTTKDNMNKCKNNFATWMHN